MEKLKVIVEEEKRRDPDGFRAAEEEGELIEFLDPALQNAEVDSALLEQLFEENEDAGLVDVLSSALDKILFEPLYQLFLPSNNMGIAELTTHLKSSSKVLIPLRKVKIVCIVSASLFFGLGIWYGIRMYILHFLLFLLLAADLFRISYNCYDKKYCSLYLHLIGGSPERAVKTILKSAKCLMGMSKPKDEFVGVRKQVLWENLMQNTVADALYKRYNR